MPAAFLSQGLLVRLWEPWRRMAAAPADKFPAGARALALAIRHPQADVLRRVSGELAGPLAVAGGVGAAAAGPEPRAEPGRAGRHPARHRAGGQSHAATMSAKAEWRNGEGRAELARQLETLFSAELTTSLYQKTN